MTEQVADSPNEDIAQQVETLVLQLFGESMDMDMNTPILGVKDEDLVAANLHDLVRDPGNNVIEISEDGKVAAFNVVIPIEKMDPTRAAEAGETAYIYFTGVVPDQQRKGFAKKVNDATLEVLRAKGFSFVELDAMQDSGYAGMVAKSYADAIVDSREHDDWGIGPETFFRIDLSKVDPAA